MTMIKALTRLLVAGVAAAYLHAAAPASAEEIAVKIGNFTFGPQELKVKAGTTVTWTNEDDIPHTVVSPNNVPLQSARYRRQVLVHLHDAGHLQVFLLPASAHDWNGDRGGADGKCGIRRAVGLYKSVHARVSGYPDNAETLDPRFRGDERTKCDRRFEVSDF